MSDVVEYSSDIPSRRVDLLRALVGHRIVDATRHSWWPPEVAQQRLRIEPQEVFSLTCGPLVFEFDTGLVLGIASEPRLQSIIVWRHRDADSKGLHPIHAAGPAFSNPFWRGLVGARVEKVSIFVRRGVTGKLALVPNEVGLCFELDCGVRVVGANGRVDASDDFVIISEAEFLAQPRPGLVEVGLDEIRVP